MFVSLCPVVDESSETSPGPTVWPEVSSTPIDDGALLLLPAIALGPQARDLTGQKFGRLTALRPVERHKYGEHSSTIVWLCQCSCGHLTKVRCGQLSSGGTKSCACLRREKASQSQFKDLHGKRFGRLTVVKLTGKNKHGRSLWRCLCDCGKTVTVNSRSLVQGNSTSCGCYKREKARLCGLKNIGPKNPHWNPNLTAEYRLDRRFGSDQIRNQVFMRDNYTCTLCGQYGNSLNAHHMEPWSKNPTLRFDPDNMITLCKDCHTAYHRSFPAKTANSANFILWFRERNNSFGKVG